jgi:predicted transposase YbfD/YdcC
MCGSERSVQGRTSTEIRFFIGSKKASARYNGRALRHHWGIENNLHWQLDVNFGEDQNRTKQRTAAQNLGLLRRLAVTLLKHHPEKESITCKRLQAAWNTAPSAQEAANGRAKQPPDGRQAQQTPASFLRRGEVKDGLQPQGNAQVGMIGQLRRQAAIICFEESLQDQASE